MSLPLGEGAPPGDVSDLLDRLDDEQRAAALLPDGPTQIIAPAGSGKTTVLIARLGVLLTRGVPADRICVVTFNRDAAAELVMRIGARLRPLVPTADEIEVRTLHALAQTSPTRRRAGRRRGGRPVAPAACRAPPMCAGWARTSRDPGGDRPPAMGRRA